MPTRQATAPLLDRLVDAVRAAVADELPPAQTSAQVCRVLQEFLVQPGLLPDEYRVGDPDRYRQHIIHAEPDGSFSIVALVWMPGQVTPIHDHLAWCVAGVYEGVESETRYRLEGNGDQTRLVPTVEVENEAGIAVGFAPPGDIHRVRNGLSTPVMSVHIYGANIDRLGTSIRRTYDAVVQG